MKREELKEIVISEIRDCQRMDTGEVTEKSSLVDDLGMDSLDFVELVMHLERTLDIPIPDDKISEPLEDYTVGKVVDVVYEILPNKG